MMISRLLAISLVGLQSGLLAAHAHTHSDPLERSATPHIHLCELLELFTSAHDNEGHDGEEHDADAVDLPDLMASTPPPVLEFTALDLAPVDAGPVAEVSASLSHFPLGLPPSTAGPRTPLYLAHCSLRN